MYLTLEDDHRRDSYSRRVLQAIQGFGSTRWYALGRDCGETRDQLHKFTVLVDGCNKVQAFFDVMAQKVGEKRAADKLLDACKNIQNPIFAAVKEVMDTKCNLGRCFVLHINSVVVVKCPQL